MKCLAATAFAGLAVLCAGAVVRGSVRAGREDSLWLVKKTDAPGGAFSDTGDAKGVWFLMACEPAG